MARNERERFQYRGRDRQVEDVARRSKQSGGGYDSIFGADFQVLKPREGDCTLRIMPSTWPKEDIAKYGDGWELQFYIHYNVGPDENTYLCLDKMKGETCPVCEARRDAADAEEADALKPSWRAICWAIDRDNEKAGPQLWSMPVSLFRDINTRSIDKKTNSVILIDDPDEGYDILFTREGTDKRTKYTAVEVDRDPSPLHDDERKQDRWMEFIQDNPLPTVLNFYPPEHIEQVLFGKGGSRKRDDDGGGERERGGRSGRRRLAREDSDPPEEEDTRSARRGRGEEEGRSSRGREEEPEEGRRARRGGEEEGRDSRRSRRGEPEEEQSSRRRGRGDEESGGRQERRRLPDREESSEGGGRRRGVEDSGDPTDGDGGDGEEDTSSRRSRRGRGKDDEIPSEGRRGSARRRPEPEDDGDGDKGEDRVERRRLPDKDDDKKGEDDDGDGDGSPTQQARRRLGNMRGGRR